MSIVSTFIDSKGNLFTVEDQFDSIMSGAVDGRGGFFTLVPEGTNGDGTLPGLNGSDPGIVGTLPEPVVFIEEGADLRDVAPAPGPTITEGSEPWWGYSTESVPTMAGAPAVSQTALLVLAVRTLLALVGRGGRITRFQFARLAGWQKLVLRAAGIVIGTILTGAIVDRILGGDGGDDGDGEGVSLALPAGEVGLSNIGDHIGGGVMDIEGVHLGAHIIGSWMANGVKFYRLSDGKIAVKNKKGRWKVWRPKKPIVLFSDGASSLKTMLRADAALTRQAKRIASMLARRAGTRKRAPKAAPVVIEHRDTHISH